MEGSAAGAGHRQTNCLGRLGTGGGEIVELKDKQLAIMLHYGIGAQLDMLIEECSELIQAICKFKRMRTTKNEIEAIELTYSIASEMADVENVIEQFKNGNQQYANLVDSIKENKTNRQILRIAEEG